MDEPVTPPVPAVKPKLGERLKTLLAQYGWVAIILYVAILVVVFAGFAVAIGTGFKVEGAGESAGLLGAAYIATKLTQPIRILVTLALTPLVARGWDWVRGRRRAPSDPSSR